MNSSVKETDVNAVADSSLSSPTLSLYSPPFVEETGCSKSPETIQEWVDSIRSNKPDNRISAGIINYNVGEENDPTVDTLHLGAEAFHSDDKAKNRHTVVTATITDSSSELEMKSRAMTDRRLSLLLMRDQQVSLQSDASSLSSLSSIETILESRREDPEEILLSLGFGGSIEPLDPLARIPKRFLNPSKVRGNCIEQFVRHQEELLETLDSGFCGYRGLSGFLKERHDPAGLVGKLLEKIRVNDRDVRSSPPTSNLTSMSEVAFSIMAVNTFRNNVNRKNTVSSSGSILDPVNREFLQQQGEDALARKGRRIIVGQDEFRVDGDGGLIHSGKIRLSSADSTMPEFRSHDESKVVEHKTSKLWSVCRQLSTDESKVKSGRLLIRQNSICVDSSDTDPNLEEVSVADTNTNTLPSTDNKLTTYKESFELEELPSQDGGEEIDDNEEQRENENNARFSSASSDSSGFLDGQALEGLAHDDNRNDKTEVDEQQTEPDLVSLDGVSATTSAEAAILDSHACRVECVVSDCSVDDSRRSLITKNRFRPIERAQQFLMIVSDEENKIVCTEGISKEELLHSSRMLASESFAPRLCASVESNSELDSHNDPSPSEEYKCDNSESDECSDFRPVCSFPCYQEEDEYNDLQQLLCVIAKEDLMPKLSRREFLSKPVDERVRLECAAIEMALQKYQLTLNSELSSSSRFKNYDEMNVEERNDLSVLRELRSGICHELAQLQRLLASRIQRANRMKNKSLPASMKLIRQFSLLLHQQNSLCHQLEQLNDPTQCEIECEPNHHGRFSSAGTQMENPNTLAEDNHCGQMNRRMQFVFQTFRERITAEVQQSIHREIRLVRREFEENSRQVNSFKNFVHKLIFNTELRK